MGGGLGDYEVQIMGKGTSLYVKERKKRRKEETVELDRNVSSREDILPL